MLRNSKVPSIERLAAIRGRIYAVLLAVLVGVILFAPYVPQLKLIGKARVEVAVPDAMRIEVEDATLQTDGLFLDDGLTETWDGAKIYCGEEQLNKIPHNGTTLNQNVLKVKIDGTHLCIPDGDTRHSGRIWVQAVNLDTKEEYYHPPSGGSSEYTQAGFRTIAVWVKPGPLEQRMPLIYGLIAGLITAAALEIGLFTWWRKKVDEAKANV